MKTEKNKILSLESVRSILADKKFNLAEVARSTDLSYRQVWLTVKKTKNPPYLVVEALSDYIQENGLKL